jgi:serine/threonine protein kinase
MILPLNFETTFYNLDTLLSLRNSPDISEYEPLFRKIFQGKIMQDSMRIIPLNSKLYAVYDKDTCIIDDEARADCYSTLKTIKNLALYNPLDHKEPLSALKIKLKCPYEHNSYNAIGITWSYTAPDTPFFETIIKLQKLAFRFQDLVSEHVPKILDFCVIRAEDKLKIRTIFEKFPIEKVAPEFNYTLSSYSQFANHINELANLANILFDEKIAHGDLSISNLVLKKNGGIKCLLDFDTASSLELLQGRYIKAWTSDLLDLIHACAFYQNNEAKEFYESKIELAMPLSDYILYEDTLAKLQDLYLEMTEKLSEFKFMSDSAELEEESLKDFLDMCNPRKIFISFVS